MELHDNTHVHKVWYVQFPSQDLMAMVFRHGDGPWEGEYRFRYYKDNKAFGSEDEKRFYNLKCQDGSESSLDHICDAMDQIAQAGVTDFGGELTEVPVDGGIDDYVREMSKQPWCNIKFLPPMGMGVTDEAQA